MAGLAVCRSTGPVDCSRCRSIELVDRRAQDVHTARLVGRSTGSVDRQRASALWKRPRSADRSTSREFCSLYPAPVDWAVNRPESRCSLNPGPVDRAVDRWHDGQKSDRWLIDRKGKIALRSCQQADLFWGYIYPISWAVLNKFLESEFSIFQQVLKEFWV